MSMLTGTVLEWFVSLPDGHVTSFAQFSTLFREQYIINRPPASLLRSFRRKIILGTILEGLPQSIWGTVGEVAHQGRGYDGARFQEGNLARTLQWVTHQVTKADLLDVVPHDNDPVVFSVVTTGSKVHRVLVDQGSSTNVMFWSTFNKLQLSPDQLRPYTDCLYGVVGDQVEVRWHIELRTTFTDGVAFRTKNIRYLVVNALSAYNILVPTDPLTRALTKVIVGPRRLGLLEGQQDRAESR